MTNELEALRKENAAQAAAIKELEEAYQVSLGLNKSYLERCAAQAAVIKKLKKISARRQLKEVP